MQRLNSYRMRLVLVGFVAGIVFGSGRVDADFTFGEPTNLPAYLANSSSSSYYGDDLCVSACGRFLFFGSTRPGGQGGYDIWSAARASVSDDWDTPVNLGATVNSPTDDTDPSISVDLLSLFFSSERSGGSGGSDLYVTTRATTEDPWSEPVNLGPTVNSTGNDSDPSISADGLSLYFSTWHGPRPGGLGGDDIWVTTRKTADDTWSEPVNLGPSTRQAMTISRVFRPIVWHCSLIRAALVDSLLPSSTTLISTYRHDLQRMPLGESQLILVLRSTSHRVGLEQTTRTYHQMVQPSTSAHPCAEPKAISMIFGRPRLYRSST